MTRPSKVCEWTEADVDTFLETGRTPNCLYHEHFTREDADYMSVFAVTTVMDRATGDYNKVYMARFVHTFERIVDKIPEFPKFSAIVLNDPRVWKIAKSAGLEVHQLLPG